MGGGVVQPPTPLLPTPKYGPDIGAARAMQHAGLNALVRPAEPPNCSRVTRGSSELLRVQSRSAERHRMPKTVPTKGLWMDSSGNGAWRGGLNI